MSDLCEHAAALLGPDYAPPWDDTILVDEWLLAALERRLREKGLRLSMDSLPEGFGVQHTSYREALAPPLATAQDADETTARLTAAVEAAEKLKERGEWE